VSEHFEIKNRISEVIYLIKHLYDLFIEKDCEMLVVDPLALTTDGRLIAAGGRIQVDNDAAYRQA
jgi:succinyl-CoA synthetase beta subunit